MKRNLCIRENLNLKEVKMMKKLVGILIVSLVVVMGGMFSQASAQLIANDTNVIYFNNYEFWTDEDGGYLDPTEAPEVTVGMHFVGIINIQGIYVNGIQTYYSSPTDQITGVFAQQIEQIYTGFGTDPYDPLNLTHITLGAPAVTMFTGFDGTTFDTGLVGDEMFALYHDTGPGTTPFETNGTIAQDVDVATDGALWLTLGYADPAGDGVGEPGNATDDTGYAYSHGDIIGVAFENLTGETWAGLNAYVNNTGYPMAGIEDPNEMELDQAICGFNGCLMTDVHLSGELEPWQENWRLDGTSPWDFASNDPAFINPIPEPGTILLLGTGLLGLGAYGIRRRK